MSQALVKICGTTSRADAVLSLAAGADFLGVVLDHAPSPRCVALEEAPRLLSGVLEGSSAVLVALSVNKPLQWHLRAAQVRDPLAPRVISQLHGDEEAGLVRELKRRGFEVWSAIGGEGEAARERALQMLAAGADALVMDARAHGAGGVIYGGTGQRGDWNLAASLAEQGARVVLAGGLSPQNVARAIAQVQPWAVDCVSGVEAGKGVKDAAKVRAFVHQARSRAEGSE